MGRGTQILAEKPLATLLAGLLDTHDNKRFFANSEQPHTGFNAMKTLRDRLPAEKKAALGRLRNGKGTASEVFATNSVGHTVIRDGQEYIAVHVYNDISRINHSCRPNAYLSWDAERGVGTVHALIRLNVGDEITIDYIDSPEEWLQKGEDRQKELKSHWEFDCYCAACKQQPDEAEDDKRREAALKLWNSINESPDPGSRRQSENEALSIIADSSKYNDLLDKLKLEDVKSAVGHSILAKQQDYTFEQAKFYAERQQSKKKQEPHCFMCKKGSPRPHLEQALAAAQRAWEIYISCCGRQHTDTLKARDYFEELTVKGA